MAIEPRQSEYPRHLAELVHAFFQAVDPAQAVARVLRLEARHLVAGDSSLPLADDARVYLAALGKAAPGMAQATRTILGDRLTQGVVTVPHGMQANGAPGLEYISAGHPLPDKGSLAAGQAVRQMLGGARPQDVLLALVSGGGSAMLEIPVPGVTLDDLQMVNDLLIRSGATIHEINCVRRSLSAIKGGGLAALAAPARTLGLLISDVVGDRLESIASGPTVPASGTRESAHSILEFYGLEALLPSAVTRALRVPPTPAPLPAAPMNVLVATNRLGLLAAARAATGLGFYVQLISEPMQGETHQVARSFALALRQAAPPACLLLGGETTLVVEGGGHGGRNQSFALAAAGTLEGCPERVLAALASDGVDGPTNAAGAIVDGQTAADLRRQGVDAQDHLLRRDAYPALQAIGRLILGGPTGTNVGDLAIGLAYAA